MLSTINKYPYFDLSEIITETDLTYKHYKKLNPVKTGNLIPDINLVTEYKRWKNFYNGASTNGPVSLRHLFGKPLTIAFYSKYWGEYGVNQLIQLNFLQNEIKANGGNLLILTDEINDKVLANIAWEHSLSLNFYYDINNEVAKKFRVYSEEDPTWNTFSGIEANVPRLAIYVMDTDRHIVYDHIDATLAKKFTADELINAVYGAALITIHKKSA